MRRGPRVRLGLRVTRRLWRHRGRRMHACAGGHFSEGLLVSARRLVRGKAAGRIDGLSTRGRMIDGRSAYFGPPAWPADFSRNGILAGGGFLAGWIGCDRGSLRRPLAEGKVRGVPGASGSEGRLRGLFTANAGPDQYTKPEWLCGRGGSKPSPPHHKGTPDNMSVTFAKGVGCPYVLVRVGLTIGISKSISTTYFAFEVRRAHFPAGFSMRLAASRVSQPEADLCHLRPRRSTPTHRPGTGV